MMEKKEVGMIPIQGNHIKLTGFEDFSKGTLINMTLDEGANGVLRTSADAAADGIWISPVYSPDKPFNDLVLSWNCSTPVGTYLEVFGRVYLPEYDGWTDPDGYTCSGWSDWITWGKWGAHIARNCPYQQDTHARKDSTEDNGWVYSSSRYCGGDSSLNVRGEMTAAAFQIKAVLHAEEECRTLPTLRLIAATWKNTLDPNWQCDCTYPEETVAEKEAVLLDTPAISQVARDPDYGGVICSATCMTMLMNGQGADYLPEDVALSNYDYGFGGNGNWSYTCALAGEHGYESYVSYSSFEAIRQELNRGYGVALSVKYSTKADDSLPYLAHGAANRTNGHLITIVGYYYSEKLGEYVYYSNDPAAKCDTNVAHREYSESHLNKCWYRRAAYFLHGKQEGAEDFTRKYIAAELRPVAEHPDPWVLTANGREILLPIDFLERRRERFGSHGTICYYVDDEPIEVPEPCRRVTANHQFYYDGFNITAEGYLTFDNGHLTNLLKSGKKVTLYVINNSGTVWTANYKL